MIRRLGSTMPFPPVPPPPPARAPGLPARAPAAPEARHPPESGGARLRPAGALAARCGWGEEEEAPPSGPEGLLSSSWPSATLKRPPARRAPGPAPPRAPPQAAPGRPRAPAACAPARPAAGSGHSPAGATASGARTAGSGTAAGAGPDDALRFSLSLTPEAVLLIQRRHMEKQLLARPRRPLPSPSADARRLLAPCPRATAAGLSRRPAPPGGLQALDLGPRPADLRPVLKVSLLNERHKYDDVEYEEEAEVVDEGLVRKCTEWLRGVESAAGRAGPLDALPHLSTL
nr:LOW QUALITY PROTEIN: proline-rich protein 18 [Equus asinus]